MPKNALVVGAPRSGTSLTASVFAARGYYVTDDEKTEVRAGDDHNPFGYWEARDVIEANVEIFGSAGYSQHNTWLSEPITDIQIERLDGLAATKAHRELAGRYQEHAPWIWKDPRLCYTLGYWWNLLDRATTGVLLVTRDPEAVYKSFRRLDWCGDGPESRADALRRINAHFDNARGLVQSMGIPHITVDYDEYLETPAQVAARIAEHFDLEVSAADLNVRADLNHSTGRGQLGQAVYRLARKLPRGPTRFVARLLPRRFTEALFPERQYTSKRNDP